MRSNFSSAGSGKIAASARPYLDETYDLRGLNLVAPDQDMPKGETPFANNNRRFADNEDETSVSQQTRRGSQRFSTPVGEAITAENTTTPIADILLDTTRQVAIPFVAGDTGVLTRYDVTIKKSLNTRGYVIIQIYSSNIGLPDKLVGQTSIAPSAISMSYASVPSYLMDAPDLIDGETYFAVFKMQNLGVGSYLIAGTVTGTYQVSTNNQKTWVAATGSANYKAYFSVGGLIKGFTKRHPSTGTPNNRTMFALGANIYTVPNSPANPTLLVNGVHADAEFVNFVNVDDWTFILDGKSAARRWNGVDAVSAIPNVVGNPLLGLIMENRFLYVPSDDRTRINFSALYDFETYPEVNFFYIGRPKVPDDITAMQLFREGATIFTKETKWTLLGSDIKTFEPTPHVGTKGAVSQHATAVGRSLIYFMADDRHIYSWNGNEDRLISYKVGPELRKILDIKKVRLHLYKNQLRIYYNKNPDSNITYMLLYDIEQEQWFRDTGRAVMGSMEWTFDDNELIEFSSRTGAFYLGETGYSDLGKSIYFQYYTAYNKYNSGLSKKRIKRFRPLVRPAESAYEMIVSKDIDFQNRPQSRPWLVDAGGAKWGTFNWGDSTTYGGSQLVDNRASMSGRGKHIQYRFEHDGIEQPVSLFGYGALIKIGKPR